MVEYLAAASNTNFFEGLPASETVEFAKRGVEEIDGIYKAIGAAHSKLREARDAVFALNTVAATIRNVELRNIALDMADASSKKCNVVDSLRNNCVRKLELQMRLMSMIAQGCSAETFLTELRAMESRFQAVKENVGGLYKELAELESRREAALARFIGLAGLDQKTGGPTPSNKGN